MYACLQPRYAIYVTDTGSLIAVVAIMNLLQTVKTSQRRTNAKVKHAQNGRLGNNHIAAAMWVMGNHGRWAALLRSDNHVFLQIEKVTSSRRQDSTSQRWNFGLTQSLLMSHHTNRQTDRHTQCTYPAIWHKAQNSGMLYSFNCSCTCTQYNSLHDTT